MSTYDRYGNKRGEGKERVEGEKREVEGGKNHEGGNSKVAGENIHGEGVARVGCGRGNVKVQEGGGGGYMAGKPMME